MSQPAPRVLVPFQVLDGGEVDRGLVDLLRSVTVVLLGFHEVPEQTAPGQMRMTYEEEAQAELDAAVRRFTDAGGEVVPRLVFTGDPHQTFTRIAAEEDCDAILIPGPLEDAERVLVPLRGAVNMERLVAFVAQLLEGNELRATFYHVTPEEAEVEQGRLILRGAHEKLVEAGIESDRADERVVVAEDPAQALLSAARAYDAIVLGESEPSLAEAIFGSVHEQVVEAFEGPILIVRKGARGSGEG